MSGVIPLSKIQIGREGTLGTAVDCTEILRVEGAFINDSREIQPVNENVGLLVDTDRVVTPSLAAAISIPENNATFEQIAHILEMGVKAATPAADGGGSGYVYTYDLPTTAQLTPKTYTAEGGDDQQAVLVEALFAEEFTISGNVREPLKFSAGLFGRQAANDSFTSGAVLLDVEEMLFQNCKFYLNDAGSGFGATLLSNYLLGFTLNVRTGYVARFTANGNLYYSYLKQVKPEYTLDLRVEHDSNAEAEITKGRARTARLARILCEGSALSSAGSYSKKSFIVDLAGKYSAIPAIEDDEGSSVMSFSLRGGYNATAGTMGKFILVNERADLDEDAVS